LYTFHLEIPAGVSRLDAKYDYIERMAFRQLDKLLSSNGMK